MGSSFRSWGMDGRGWASRLGVGLLGGGPLGMGLIGMGVFTGCGAQSKAAGDPLKDDVTDEAEPPSKADTNEARGGTSVEDDEGTDNEPDADDDTESGEHPVPELPDLAGGPESILEPAGFDNGSARGTYQGAPNPNGCHWSLQAWLDQLDTTLEAARDCDPVTRAPGVTLAAQEQCTRDAALTSGSTGEFTWNLYEDGRYWLHVTTDDGRYLHIYVTDSSTALDRREVRIEECTSPAVSDGMSTPCVGPQIYACTEGREIGAAGETSEQLERRQAELEAAREQAEAAGLLPMGRQQTPTSAPIACHSWVPIPPIGCDPQDDRTWGVDCDQDGVPGYFAVDCTASVVQAETYDLSRDCDDANPALQVWAVEDLDADGYGLSPTDEWYCSPSAPPSGYTLLAETRDCNDEDAEVYPLAPKDVWGDGVDSNCQDGDAASCYSISSGEGLEIQVAESSDCQVPDLYISTPITCTTRPPSGSTYVFVANRGGAAFTGRAQLRWDNGEIQYSPLLTPIEPGAASSPIEILSRRPDTSFELSITDDEGNPIEDCNPKNNVLQVEVPSYLVPLRIGAVRP